MAVFSCNNVLNMQVHEFDPHCPMKEAAKVGKISRCFDFLVVFASAPRSPTKTTRLTFHTRALKGPFHCRR